MKRQYVNGVVFIFFTVFALLTSIQAQEAPGDEAARLIKEIGVNLEEKKFDELIAKANRVLELFPKSSEIYPLRAMAYLAKGEKQKAVDDFSKGLNLGVRPDLELMSYKMRGIIFYETKRYDEAIKDFDVVIVKDSSNFRNFIFRGWSYFFKGSYQAAVLDFDAALKIKPQELEIRRFRAQSHINLGNYEKAVEDINEELRINPNAAAECYKIRANAYRKLGKTALAEADEKKFVELGGKLEQAIQPKPQSPQERLEDLLVKSQAYFDKEDWNSAIRAYDEIISLLDKNDENLYAFYFARGRSFYELEKYDEALKDYNEVIQRQPGLSDGYSFRGEVYIKRNELDLALFDFNKAIRLEPKNILALRRRAEVYSLKKEFDNVIKDCDAVLKIDPKYTSAWFYRAEAYFEKGSFPLAIYDISQYIKLENEDAEAYSFRAKVYRKLGDTKSAKADEQKADELNARNK